MLVDRRAANMMLLAADLRATGELRADLSDRDVADMVWSTNGPEYYLQLRSRGWSAKRYAGLLQDLWCRLLLEQTITARPSRRTRNVDDVPSGMPDDGPLWDTSTSTP